MRNVIVSAALAAALLGCSSSGNSSSSGSTGTTGATAGTTGAATTGTGGSGSTTGTNSGTTTGATTTTGGGSTGQSSSGSGSSGSTGGTTTGSSFCSPAGTSGTVADWSCVGQVPAASGTGAITVSLTFSDALSNSAFMGVPVKLCRRADPTCAAPDATATTDQNGAASLTADIPVDGGNYDGYLQFDATDAGGGNATLPQLAFVAPFASNISLPLLGVSTSDVAGLSAFLNPLDSTKGQVIGNVADCTNSNAAGVVVGSSDATTDGGTGTYYFSGGYPTATPPTDATGNFIITNVPAGTPTITADQASDCSQVGQIQVITRPGTITTAIVTPQ